MNYWMRIGRFVIGITGYRTFETIECVPYDEGLKLIEGKTVVKRWNDPLNSSIKVVVIE